jgi:imidazolonepropionase-like amidohydrolase
LVIDGERIAALGPGLAPPAGARVVDLQGLHVYPGLIDANTILGLVEIGSVRGTVDVNEVGDLNPNVRAEVALHPDSELLPVARAGGVLVAMAAPRGGLVAGTAAVFRLDGWTWEDLTVAAPAGLLVQWPSMRIDRAPDARPSAEEQERTRDERLRSLRQAFAAARAYERAHAAAGKKGIPAHERDPRWEAMLPVVRGRIPVLVAARDVSQIRAALRWAQEEGLRMVLLSGGDVARLADEIARARVDVVLDPTWALPERRWEPYDEPFTIAARLHAAGVRFCITTGSGTFGAANARNLTCEAAAAVAHGLPPEEGLRAITQRPAEILGVGDRLGTLAPGKEATLIVTDGDPLDIRTHVVRAFIAGREVSLETRQTRLWERYRARPR